MGILDLTQHDDVTTRVGHKLEGRVALVTGGTRGIGTFLQCGDGFRVILPLHVAARKIHGQFLVAGLEGERLLVFRERLLGLIALIEAEAGEEMGVGLGALFHVLSGLLGEKLNGAWSRADGRAAGGKKDCRQ